VEVLKMRSRFFGAASMDDDEDDEDYDMSGFVGDQVPPKPPIMERPRVNEIPPTEEAEHIGASSYAGPTALRRQVTGKTGMAFIAGNYAYLSQSLGYNHGVLESNLGERHWLIEHPAKIVAHGLLGFTAFKLFRR
jgi:hypothetical protein